MSFQFKDLHFDLNSAPQLGSEPLRRTTWREGGIALLGTGPGPRHGIFAVMSENGNRSATFDDGQLHNYHCVTGLIGADGVSRFIGGHAIPVFPNGDVLMVVVQRPGIVVSGRRTNVLQFIDAHERPSMDLGFTGSLEWAGGSVDPTDGSGEESVKTGIVREFGEESGVNLAGLTLDTYQTVDPVHQMVSDVLIWVYYGIIMMPDNIRFPSFVDNDGGIRVLRISMTDLRHNLMRGLIVAGSTLEGIRLLDTFSRMGKSGWIEQVGTYGFAKPGKMKIPA